MTYKVPPFHIAVYAAFLALVAAFYTYTTNTLLNFVIAGSVTVALLVADDLRGFNRDAYYFTTIGAAFGAIVVWTLFGAPSKAVPVLLPLAFVAVAALLAYFIQHQIYEVPSTPIRWGEVKSLFTSNKTYFFFFYAVWTGLYLLARVEGLTMLVDILHGAILGHVLFLLYEVSKR
jgi:hypothetical protein